MLSETFHALRSLFSEMVHTICDEKLKTEVRTSLPGYILSFDATTQLAILQVGIQRLNVDGKKITPPPIVECPVCIPGATGGAIEVEIQPGDECLIHFSMRCIDGWRIQGGVAPLDSVERFRQSDAFAVLAPRSSGNVIPGYDNNGIKVRSKDGTKYVWLKNDSTIDINNGSCNVTLNPDGTVDINGLTITGSGNIVTASGTDLDYFAGVYNIHIHPGGSIPSPQV